MLSFSLPKLNTNPIFLFPTNSYPYPFNIPQTHRPNPKPKPRPNTFISATSTSKHNNENEEDQYQLLTAITSMFNNIVILESKTSKVLLLDNTGNIHSILYKSQIWTNSYWDEFSSLPAIVPKPGPIAIFGLGGGTVAHQLLHFWPNLDIHGWEIDEILVDQARIHLGLSELECRVPERNGILRVCIGDALSELPVVNGGYAGIIVDLFGKGEILSELKMPETWLKMEEKLMPNGRIMVNCGGVEVYGVEGWEENIAIKAMCEAFGGKFVNWKKMGMNESGNYMAFTGVLPDLELWAGSVPHKLSYGVHQWRSCE